MALPSFLRAARDALLPPTELPAGDTLPDEATLMQSVRRNARLSTLSQVAGTINMLIVPATVGALMVTGLTPHLLLPLLVSLGLYGIIYGAGYMTNVGFGWMELMSKITTARQNGEMVVEAVREVTEELRLLRADRQQDDHDHEVPAPAVSSWTDRARVVGGRQQTAASTLQLLRTSIQENAPLETQKEAVRKYNDGAQKFTLLERYDDEHGNRIYIWDDPRPGRGGREECQLVYVMRRETGKIDVYHGSRADAVIALAPDPERAIGAQVLEIAQGRQTGFLGDPNNRLHQARSLEEETPLENSYVLQEVNRRIHSINATLETRIA